MITHLQLLEAEHNVTIYRCSGCERLFVHDDNHTMYLYVELAKADTVSHGICSECSEKQKGNQ